MGEYVVVDDDEVGECSIVSRIWCRKVHCQHADSQMKTVMPCDSRLLEARQIPELVLVKKNDVAAKWSWCSHDDGSEIKIYFQNISGSPAKRGRGQREDAARQGQMTNRTTCISRIEFFTSFIPRELPARPMGTWNLEGLMNFE